MMASGVQVENGNFTRIHNDIAEQLSRADLNGAEFRCLWFLLRKTYGYQKKQDQISYSQFAEGTGMERRSAIRALDKLVKRKIIYSIDNGNNRPQTWGFNKYFDRWNHSSDQIDTTETDKTSDQIGTSFDSSSDQIDTTSSDQIDTKTSDQIDTHKRKKEIERKGEDVGVVILEEPQQLPPPPVALPDDTNGFNKLMDAARKRNGGAYGKVQAVVGEQVRQARKFGVSEDVFREITDIVLDGMGKLSLANSGDDESLIEGKDVALALVRLHERYRTPVGVQTIFDTWVANGEFKGKPPSRNQVKGYASQILDGKIIAKSKAAQSLPPVKPVGVSGDLGFSLNSI